MKGNSSDIAQREMISSIKKNLDLENLDKLGVKEENFLQQFDETPPGVLPLKCLSFFIICICR